MSTLKDWLKVNKAIKELQEKKLALEVSIYKKHREKMDQKLEGSISVEEEGLKLTVTKGLSYKVDQEIAEVVQTGFRKKWDLDKSLYKKLDPDTKESVDNALTVSIRKPSFKVEEL